MTNEIQRLRFRVRQLEREVRALRAASPASPEGADRDTHARPDRNDERAVRDRTFGRYNLPAAEPVQLP